MKLRRKTSLLFALLVALALLASGAPLLLGQQRALEASVVKSAEGLAAAQAHTVAVFVKTMQRDAERLAAVLPAEALQRGDTATLQRILQEGSRHLPQFANGLFVLDAQGRFVVDQPAHRELWGSSFAYREYFQRTRDAGRSVVSVPYHSTRTQRQVVSFTAPVLDAQGRFAGMVGCSVDLLSPDALGSLTALHLGDTGYAYIVDRSLQVIVHPERERILQRDIAPGSNLLLERALAGVEASGGTVNSRGVPMLLALRQIEGTDWLLGVQQTQAEAFAPVRQASRRMVLVLLAGAVVAAIVGAVLVRRVTTPVTVLDRTAREIAADLRRHGHARHAGAAARERLRQVRGDDEIAGLAASFDELLEQLEEAIAVAQRAGRDWSELSAQLASSNAQLQALHASRTQLLASACHDLRQPAHALAMLAELAGDEQDPAERQHKLAGIRRCSSTLTDMLAMLMDLTQLEGGHYAPSLQPLLLDDLMREVELHYGAAARRKGLQFSVAHAGVGVRSDRHMLRRIVFNLVSNAVKYTVAGGVQVLVQEQGDEVQLTVRDTGPGIPPDRLEDVFADHVRLGAQGDVEGLGIGLPIVRRAAQLLGHRLQLASTPGAGTTATLSLPRAAALGPTSESAQAGHGDTAGGRLVALVEDDTESREAMAALLQRWGFRVMAAADFDALSARLDAAPGELPVLLVTDLHLRSSHALDAVQPLRRRAGMAGLPVLLVTGDVAFEVAEQARAQRIAVVHKPLMPKRLRAAIDEAIRSRGEAPEPLQPVIHAGPAAS